MLLKSRRLITDLVRKNKSDSWYYEKAIYIMVTTLVWLIIRRFLYGPFYLFVWVPLKLCWWMLSLVASIIGAGGNHDSEIIGGGKIAPEEGKERIVSNQMRVEIKGIPEELPQIPQSLLPTPEIAPEISNVAEVSNTPEVVATEVVEAIESKPVDEEKSSYQRPDPPPMTPYRENESLLEQVGRALDQQREEARAREHAPMLQGARHDEL